MTKWAADVNPDAPLPEYPRPQMVRPDWANLNGLWDFAITKKDVTATPTEWDSKILVPFPVESALSGVKKTVTPEDRVWYHRSFTVDPAWNGKHVLLHFGAVDYDTIVSVNGTDVAHHVGGYDEFQADITAALKPGPNELVVNVYDATGENQPIGKQRVKGDGIFYTGCTGIWQTVWIEPVAEAHVDQFVISTDIDNQTVTIDARGTLPSNDGTPSMGLIILDDGKEVARGGINQPIHIANPHLWSPEDPHLFTFKTIALRQPSINFEPLEGYFAFRKISLGKDDQGHQRVMLNNQFVFQRGVLDQGYWPDGIYTAPTDEALKFDIETTRRLGFNMCRKHAKVEPERWYYWADKLGLLVWQDMPQAFAKVLGPDASKQWDLELTREIETHRNHPSIIGWTTFNEGWGEHDVPRVVDNVKKLDPTRLVNNASGWTDMKVGDINDTHHYPPPWCENPEPSRAVICGEFGGLGMRVADHMWAKNSWGYQGLSSNSWHLTRHYQDLIKQAYVLRDSRAMSGYCYTQLTDVETESNGLLTYDRAVVKVDEKIAAAANAGDFQYMPPNPNPALLETSVDEPAKWNYTTDKPAEDWMKADFDDKGWKTGTAPFGHDLGGVNTDWKTSDIWIRREFALPNKLPDRIQFDCFHDEDVAIFINGVPAGSATGYVNSYTAIKMTPEGRAALKPGHNVIAAHVHQTTGGQFIDIGLSEVITPGQAVNAPPVPGPPTGRQYARMPMDWRWVHGAVFVPTNCVNEAQQWDQYDPVYNDRELHTAGIYGINLVRVFLHYDIYLKDKTSLLAHIEDFLTRADKYGIKVEFVFFDDCWNQPPVDILKKEYQYPAPIFGVHNSRWLVSPGTDVKSHFAEHSDRLKAYVQDVVNAHKDDPRIVYWETYNEPDKSEGTTRLGTAALAWIKETGSPIPVTATGTDSAGDPYAGFKSWHTYDGELRIKQDPMAALCTECMCRKSESVPAVVDAFKGKTGFVIWEYGIGRDDCRFAWDQNGDHPATAENEKPFHGMIYPDGHPWSTDDVKALLGAEKYARSKLFSVEYFKTDHFTDPAKQSVTPYIDFDLLNERGFGSPDASVGIPTDHFSTRWTGTIKPATAGEYRFELDGDGNAKLFVDEATVVESPGPGRVTSAASIRLDGGMTHTVRIEYVHSTGNPSLHVNWSGPGVPRTVLMSETTGWK